MKSLYGNGLMVFSQREILKRNQLVETFSQGVWEILRKSNKAWSMHQIETPILTPKQYINKNYGSREVFSTDEFLTLRPETTHGSYFFLERQFGSGVRPPICVWQVGKSFRREQDSPTKHVRLKEFYQQEFQCVYTEDTANDYQSVFAPQIEQMIAGEIKLPTRIVNSDRLPDYSVKTLDVEVNNGDKWMEVCSISVRKDFNYKVNFGKKEVGLLVCEIAIGVDRCMYNCILEKECSE